MGFAEDIKTMREDLGLSIQEAAKKIGVAYNTFKRYETGESVPPKEKQDEIFIKLNNTAEETEIDILLNDIAAKEIARMKQKADENRLLIPLLRQMGIYINTRNIGKEVLYNWAEKDGKLDSDTCFQYEMLLEDLEVVKKAIRDTLIERHPYKYPF